MFLKKEFLVQPFHIRVGAYHDIMWLVIEKWQKPMFFAHECNKMWHSEIYQKNNLKEYETFIHIIFLQNITPTIAWLPRELFFWQWELLNNCKQQAYELNLVVGMYRYITIYITDIHSIFYEPSILHSNSKHSNDVKILDYIWKLQVGFTILNQNRNSPQIYGHN